jgi:xanthine dehydrogenase accessory factor
MPAPWMQDDRPLAFVLGTGDIASAAGRSLHLAGFAVLLLRDPATPVLRRGMAFDDAVEAGWASLEGVTARRQSHAAHRPGPEGPLVSRDHLAAARSALPDVRILVDARLRKYAEPEDLRALAPLAIGVGPGFDAGGNVHLVVESLPGAEGRVIANGAAAVPSGKAVPLGGAGSERFVYATAAGRWEPLRALGDRVAAGEEPGHVGEMPVTAPIAGQLRGLVRARPTLPRGTKLVEMDPREEAAWRGIAPRAARIAAGVVAALGHGGAAVPAIAAE